MSATSCTISAGTPARPACARTRRTRIWSGATSSCRACARRGCTSSTPSRIRRNPKIVKVIEPEEIAEKAGYSRLHTIHCGPEGIYVNALGNAEGKAPGGIFLLDPDSFDVLGQWEIDRGPQQLAYDFWWHLGHDTMVTSEWGTPDTFENGLVPEVLLGSKYGRRLHFWDLHKRKHLQEIDLGRGTSARVRAAPGARSDQGLRLRRLRHQPQGSLGLDLDLVSRRRQMGGEEGHRDPGRAGRSGPAAAGAEGLQGGRRRWSPTSTCRWTTASSTCPAGAPAT